MLKSKYILFAVFLLAAAGVSAQKAERDYIRKGNRLFNDSVFVDAEVNYRKALEANPKSTVSMYNLGNTLSQQQKFQDAMEQYVSASKIEKDKIQEMFDTAWSIGEQAADVFIGQWGQEAPLSMREVLQRSGVKIIEKDIVIYDKQIIY